MSSVSLLKRANLCLLINSFYQKYGHVHLEHLLIFEIIIMNVEATRNQSWWYITRSESDPLLTYKYHCIVLFTSCLVSLNETNRGWNKGNICSNHRLSGVVLKWLTDVPKRKWLWILRHKYIYLFYIYCLETHFLREIYTSLKMIDCKAKLLQLQQLYSDTQFSGNSQALLR